MNTSRIYRTTLLLGIFFIFITSGLAEAKEKLVVLGNFFDESVKEAMEIATDHLREQNTYEILPIPTLELLAKEKAAITSSEALIYETKNVLQKVGIEKLIWIVGWSDFETIFYALLIDFNREEYLVGRGLMNEAHNKLKDSLVKGVVTALTEGKYFLPEGPWSTNPKIKERAKWPDHWSGHKYRPLRNNTSTMVEINEKGKPNGPNKNDKTYCNAYNAYWNYLDMYGNIWEALRLQKTFNLCE